jgi:hypothetical protein
MTGELMDNGGTAVAAEAVKRVINDPYARHLVELINSGRFTEPAAVLSLREELTEHMGDLIGDEEAHGAHWA